MVKNFLNKKERSMKGGLKFFEDEKKGKSIVDEIDDILDGEGGDKGIDDDLGVFGDDEDVKGEKGEKGEKGDFKDFKDDGFNFLSDGLGDSGVSGDSGVTIDDDDIVYMSGDYILVYNLDKDKILFLKRSEFEIGEEGEDVSGSEGGESSEGGEGESGIIGDEFNINDKGEGGEEESMNKEDVLKEALRRMYGLKVEGKNTFNDSVSKGLWGMNVSKKGKVLYQAKGRLKYDKIKDDDDKGNKK